MVLTVRSLSSRVIVLALWLIAFAPAAQAQNTGPVAAPPPIAAKSWLLLDYQTNRIITSSAADDRVEPASLTKLMTAYLVFSALKQKQITLQQTLPVSEHAWKMAGSRMFVEPSRPVTVDELLHGMIVQSGNDATTALAEGVAGSEQAFVQRMNEQAGRLDLKQTKFANPTGLPDPQHYSSASDLGMLAQAVIRDFPEYFPYYAIKDYTYNRITQRNRNDLLFRDPFVDGIKSGYTDSAGYCLIATARRDERRLIAVVTGAASENARAMEAQKLLNYGFQFYDTVRLYASGATVAEIPIWKGSEKNLKAGFARDVFATIPKGRSDALKMQLESMQPLIAPISMQQSVGILRVTFDDKPYGEFPVVALQQVGVANVFGRAWDTIRLWFQ